MKPRGRKPAMTSAVGHSVFMKEKNGKPSEFKTIGAARKAAKAWQTMWPSGAYAIERMPMKSRPWRKLMKKVLG